MPFTSHTKYHTNVARALVDLGHEVWLTMPDCLVEKGVLDVSGFTVVRYKTNKDFEESAISAHMTFLERVANTLLNLLFMCTDRTVYSDAVARYAPEMPYLPMDMLLLKAELWLIETDHILDYPKPSLPNIKFIGGTATGPAKPLPSEFKSFMDGATEGVVIVSFGSYVIGVPKQMGEKLLEVFLRLPMKVVFRSNLTSPDPAMIMMSPWIPQNDLLGHPNTKVFVSHCALPTDLAEKGYQDISGFHSFLYDTVPDLEMKGMEVFSEPYFKGKESDIDGFLTLSFEHLDSVLRNDSFLAVVRELDPDLIVIDNLAMLYMLAIIPYRLGKPFAFVGSSYYPTALRVPFSPAVDPMQIVPMSNKMTFSERMMNTFLYVHFFFWNPSLKNDAVATYAPEMPYIPLDMLIAKAEIWLVEMDHILDYPRPSLPNVKLIGGTATGPVKPLPPEFRSFMDGATDGVVIVSFGSYVLDVPTEISDKLFKVFDLLPMKVVFRTPLASPDPNKIMTSPWLPQNDLLGHPNTKVFVSHCGKNGQYEALHHAVPIVATPIFGDQPYNAVRVQVKGFAEIVDLRTVSAEELTATILKVAREPRYKAAIRKASRLFRQQFGVPMEEAARWLDHVMEYGGGSSGVPPRSWVESTEGSEAGTIFIMHDDGDEDDGYWFH
nr:hypothetical protein BaRGS_025062 [Batillaria attramentaria]